MFDDFDDRRTFYSILARAVARGKVLCHGDVLMGNHFHLFLEGVMADVSSVMWRVNHQYALAYNERHGRDNHLVGQRFWSTPVADERGARAVTVYIALNPVRAGLCEDPAAWVHGSLRAHLGLDEPRPHLALGFTHELFVRGMSLGDMCAAVAREGQGGRPALAAIMPEPEYLTRVHIDQAVKTFGYTRADVAGFYGVDASTLRRWLRRREL